MSKVNRIGTFFLMAVIHLTASFFSFAGSNVENEQNQDQLISISTVGSSETYQAPANPSCDSNVPHFFVDLTGKADSVWHSTYISREGNCCGTSNPDRCISFTVILDKNAVGLVFDIDFGAIPPGALFYQVDCGPETQVGEGICLPGGQVYEVTFCKPGNNKNIYSIRSTPGIIVPDEISTRYNCSADLEIAGVDAASVTWNDITGGGAYNSYLSCTSGCLTNTVTPDELAPSQILYEVCGDIVDETCGAIYNVCDTVVVNVYPEVEVSIDEDLLSFCEGSPNTLTATATPASGTYSYEWYDDYNATGNLVSSNQDYVPTEGGSFSVVATDFSSPLGCSSDTLNFDVTILPLPVFNLADRLACTDDTIEVDLPDGNTYSWSPTTGIINDSDPTKFRVALPSDITYTITATDPNGCSYDDSWTITLTDCLPQCAEATVCPNDNFEITSVPEFIAAGGQTNFPCSMNDANIEFISAVSDGGNCPEIITQTYRLWDDCGNTAFCDVQVTKTDTIAPNLTAPTPVTTNDCDASSIPPFASLADFIAAGGTVSDDCGIDASTFALLKDSITSTGCPVVTTRTYVVEDECGNPGTVEHQIISEDVEAPVLNGIPSDITLECVSPADPPVIYTEITATDNCDTSVVITFSETSTQTFDNSYTSVNYQVTRTWTATDACNNSTSQSQLITVVCEFCGNGVDDDGDGLIDADDPDCPCTYSNVNLDCENIQHYYIPPVWQMNPSYGGGATYTDPSSLVISTPFGTANVTIKTADGTTFNQSLTVNQGTAEVIPLTNELIQTPNYNTTETNRGLIIESDQLIQVLYRITADNNKMLVTIKGEQALGTRFRAGSQTNVCGDPDVNKRENHFISVMAVEDNTTINFDFTADMKGLGTSHSITLNAGETYLMIDNDVNQTVTGTLISSDKSITVISGSQHSRQCNGNGRDGGADQLIPTCGIGSQYVVFRGIDDDATSEANYAIVVGAVANTEVFINGNSTPVATLNPGEFYTYNMPAPNYSRHYIETSKPAYVYQFGSIQENGEIGMAIAAPIDGCRGDNFVEFFKFPNSTTNNITALVPNAGLGSLKLNGNPYTNYSTAESIPGLPDWSAVTFDNSAIQDYNVLESDELLNVSQFVGNSSGGTFGFLTSFKDKITVYDPATGLPSYNYFADTICATVPYEHCITSSSCSGNQRILSIVGSTHTDSYTIQPNSSCFSYTAKAGYSGSDTITVLLSDEYGFTQAVCVNFYICGEAPVFAGLDSIAAVCDISEIPAYADYDEFVAEGGSITDDCSGLDETTFHLASETSDGNTCPETITRVYEISNSCGITSSFEQKIIIDNTILPTLSGVPNDTTVNCDAIPAPPVIGTTVIGQSNCGIPPTVDFTETRTDGACANSYRLTRTWTVTDECGNEYAESQLITVIDTIPPTAGDPATLNVQCVSEIPLPDSAEVTDANDNCSSDPVVSFVSDVSDGNTCPETITRTYSITDECGNETFVEQTIIVQDDTPPTASNPAPIQIQCEDQIPAPDGTVVTDAMDNCTANPVITFVADVSDGNTCPETITRTYLVADECGNEITVEQEIIIRDDLAPTITCLPDTTIFYGAEIPEAANTLNDFITNGGSVSDNCGLDSASFVLLSENTNVVGENGVLKRVYQISDVCGNSASCEQTITINKPVIITEDPTDDPVDCIDEVNPPFSSFQELIDNGGSATSECGIDTTTFQLINEVSDGNSCPQIITRTYEVSDSCGHKVNLTSRTIVDDKNAPTIDCLPDTTVYHDSLVPPPASSLEDFILRGGTITDNCQLDSTSFTLASEVPSTVGDNTVITRTYSVADACGNTATCEQTITVDEPETTSSNPPDDTVECIDEVNPPFASFEELIDNGGNASSECGLDTTSFRLASEVSDGNTCPQVITRTYEIEDSCGNSIPLVHETIVDDQIDPLIDCLPNTTVYYDSLVPPPATSLDEFILQGGNATDNCLLDSTSFTLVSEVPAVVGDNTVITRTYSIADACGNTATCEQTITVDEPETTSSNPPDDTVECIDEVNPPFASFEELIDNGGNASSECGLDTTSFRLASEVSDGNICPQVITRTYEIEDSCGNSIPLVHETIVDDQIDPVIDCLPNTTVYYDSLVPPPATSLDEFILQGGNATDNCLLDSTSFTLVSEVPSTVDENTVITRTYSIADACGNTATCEQTITVDEPETTSSNPPDDTVECIDEVNPPFASFEELIDNGGNASSECGLDTTSFRLASEVSDGNTCPQTITRIYSVADLCGNILSIEHKNIVDDQTDPVIDCLPNTTVYYDSLVPPPAASLDEFILQGGNATDNCLLDSTSFTLVSEVPVVVGDNTVITRTYSIADACGNTATCEQTITVDEPETTSSNPPDDTVECIDEVNPPFASFEELIDNGGNASSECGLDTTSFRLASEVSDGNTCPQVITRTYEIEDSCGNSIPLVHQTIVDDQIDPVIDCLPNTTVYYDSLVPPPATSLDEFILQGGNATDNCLLDSTSFTLVSEVPAVVGDNTVITRTYSIADACGNTATCEQTITVDEPETTSSNPPDDTVECIDEVNPPFASFEELIDNGGNASSECGLDTNSFKLESETSDGNSCPQTITRVYSVADLCGNILSIEHKNIVDDQTDPVIDCLPNTTVYYDSLVPPPATSLDDFILQGGNATDNCLLDSTSFTLVSEVPAVVGDNTVITRTYSIADACGNTATCEQTITVDEPETTSSNPPDDTVECIDEVNPPFSSFEELIDNGGNASSECGLDTTSFRLASEVSDENTCPQVITRTYEIEDSCGNSIPLIHETIVDDQTDPVIDCLPNTTVYYDSLVPPPATSLDEFILQGGNATDNCLLDSTSFTLVSEVPAVVGDNTVITRTYSVADACGNTTTCEQTITVDEPETTSSNPPDDTVECIDEVNPPFSSFEELIDNGGNATSECGLDTTSFRLASEISDGNTCPQVITRTYEIEDSCGNSIPLVHETIVDDQIDPVIDCLPNTTVYYDSLVPPPATSLDEFILQGGNATDNCLLDSTSFTLVSEVPVVVGDNTVITRTYSIADACGNTATCEQTITVDEPETTSSNPPDDTVECIDEVNPPFASFEELIDNGGNASSECGLDTNSFKLESETSDGNSCPQTITRIYSVADLCGNILSIEHKNIVDDQTDPVIDCLPNTTVYYDSLVSPPATSLDEFILQGGNATDNCLLDSTSFTLVSEVPVVVGDNTVITRTYSVADACGNTATCEQTITVEKPNTPPVAVNDEFSGGCNPISGVLINNDYDPDGDEIIINTTPVSTPARGDLTILPDGSFTYEFGFREAVTDSFIYEICDNHPDSKCDQAVVYINIFMDNDCDGIDDAIDIDDDDDGILDTEEGNGSIDSDGDGYPDSMDIDADNDGIVDNIEGQPEGKFIPPSGFDDNHNGLDDAYETGNQTGIDPVDTDQDGTPDYLDLDTDDDGIPDSVEGFDIGGKGIAERHPSNYDTDHDGLDDGFDSYNGRIDYTNMDNPYGSTATLQDFDDDGWRDWRDVDDDGDGIKTKYEDLDNNGHYFDDDLDYDGFPEYLDARSECELFIPEGFSPNGDGVHDVFQIYCIDKFPDAKLLIFDRWGNKLYEHEHYGNQDFWGNYEESWWDGTTTKNPGKKVVPGNYLYILETSPGASERGFVMVSY